MKTIVKIVKVLSLAAGGASFFDWLPDSVAPIAILVFATADTVKELLIKVGDYLDDGKINQSFHPDAKN